MTRAPGSARAGPRLAGLLSACCLAAGLLTWSAPGWSAEPTETVPPPGKHSFAHSGMKTATYEVGNTINNLIFLTAGTGGLVTGALLTGFNTMQSWTVYTTNDYLWEKFYPLQTGKDGSNVYDVQQSFWRTTWKYMTGKPVVASIKIAAIYVVTGSAAVAVAYGTAATAGASMVFFANNLAWDYYDQAVVGAPEAAKQDVAATQVR
jgi:hypothetical protein